MHKGFSFFKSLVRLKERTRESCFREREILPSVSLTLVQIRFIVATTVESLAPLRISAGRLRMYTYFTLGGTTGLEGNILLSS